MTERKEIPTKVFAATGAVGRPLLPQLRANGHEVTAMARDAASCDLIRREGTDPPPRRGPSRGVRGFVAHSFVGWPYGRTGGPMKSEEDPLDPHPPEPMRRTLEAIRHLEHAVLGADWTEGIVLCCGNFYGPGTGFSTNPPGAQAELIRRRRLPIVSAGSGVWSFVHVKDATTATVVAVDRGRRGLYNIVDDEPAPVSEWLPAAAEALRAKRPIRVPRWAGRLAAGEVATIMMTAVRGASNAKAKRELGWRLRYPSWRDGFVDGLG